MKDLVECEICSQEAAKIVIDAYVCKYQDRLVLIEDAEYYHCSNCDERYFTKEQLTKIEEKLKNNSNKKPLVSVGNLDYYPSSVS